MFLSFLSLSYNQCYLDTKIILPKCVGEPFESCGGGGGGGGGGLRLYHQHLWWSKYDPQNNVKSSEFYDILRKVECGGAKEAAGEPRGSRVLKVVYNYIS